MGSHPQKSGRLLTSRWRWGIHLILITGYVLVTGALGFFEHKGLPGPAPRHPAAGLLFDCAWEMVSFGLVFGLAFYFSRVTPDELLLQWRGRFKPLLLGIGFSIGLRVGVGILLQVFFVILITAGIIAPYQILDIASAHRSGIATIVNGPALHHDQVYFLLALTVVSFGLAGLREELWRSAYFAGVKALWPQSFSSRLGQIGVVTSAAMIFGFGHSTQGLIGVIHAGMMGFGFGLIMVFYRSIWPAVIAHGLFDATSIFMMALEN
jgi:membrane protease YdiL (CAAX protease family)